MILQCKSAREAWLLLHERLSPTSETHLRSLRDRLRILKKDPHQKMIDYLFDAKSLFDALLASRSTMTEKDLTDYVVDGLGAEYQGFISSLTFRSSTTFDELHQFLLREEQILAKFSSPAAALFTNYSSRGRGGKSRSYGRNNFGRSYQNHQGCGHQSGRQYGNRNFTSRGGYSPTTGHRNSGLHYYQHHHIYPLDHVRFARNQVIPLVSVQIEATMPIHQLVLVTLPLIRTGLLILEPPTT